jgi:glyoxylase-like metal-dependent hydrolase (beta-lactamase superfamily II)
MIPFVRDFDFEYGRSDQVSPLIRRVVARNPGPFTFTGTGTYIVGRGAVAVIDPGPADPEHLEALTQAVAGEQVTQVLVTHTHADHSPLARPFAARQGAPVFAARPPAALDHAAARLGARTEEDADAAFVPDVVLEGGERLSGPGWTIEALATPGHASNHLAFALLEENALFCGDHVMGWSTTVVAPPDGDMGAYYQSLDRVAARGFATLWPTHGPPVAEPAPFLAAYTAHRRARERQILRQIEAGRATIAQMVPEIYAEVDPRLWPAAAMSVLAHLLHLHREGVVEAEPEPGPQARFRLSLVRDGPG